jgi:hypothetical protein
MRARAVVVRVIAMSLAAAAAAWAVPRYEGVFVGGGSMEPALYPGDLVVLRRHVAAPSPGDVVLVPKPGWPRGVLHRLAAMNADGSLALRGDANPVGDRDPVDPGSLRGVMIAVVPCGRVFAEVERLMRRWYNPAPTRRIQGLDGETQGAREPSAREGPA